MKVRSIHNKTDKTIPTDYVKNGAWAGWEYLFIESDGLYVPDEEVKRLEYAGALVTPVECQSE